ncbi:MAG: lysine--tRNA ligase [Candidatus Aenigmarchaeota archaeon]|nr:lysine--tRNA ligase [Candidatus Aenigmarchaeota archaeon]
MGEVFWSDDIASLMINRKKYNHIDKAIEPSKSFAIKSSTSISGVPHIGNASDVIRHDAVVRSLREKGMDVRFLWIAEDMDALRKVPAGIPDSFSKYLGMPVADIPDPEGCHKTYSEHFCTKFVDSLSDFGTKPEYLSTSKEYRAGNFSKWIKLVFENLDGVREILDKGRRVPLAKNWVPWKPVCQNCGKLMTTRVTDFDSNSVKYVCEDYQFQPYGEKAYTKLSGCGFKGDSDMKNGKLLWRVEWGMLWAYWKVNFEGAGKEHFMPSGSFWSAGEIAEKIFDWPEPYPGENYIQPYEYLTISGKKMSASVGNVVATWDWPSFAPPQVLRLLFLKKPNRVRDFSYEYIPKYMDEFYKLQRVYFGKEEDDKEEFSRRLYLMSEVSVPDKMPAQIPFDYAAMVAQMVPEEGRIEKAVQIFRATKHLGEKYDAKALGKMLDMAKEWSDRYGGPSYKINLQDNPPADVVESLTDNQKSAIRKLVKALDRDMTEDELYAKIFEIIKESDISSKGFFKAIYTILIGRPYGPRLAQFILIIGRNRIRKILEKI